MSFGSIGVIIGVTVGAGAVLILIMLLSIMFYKRWTRDRLVKNLPPKIRSHYEDGLNSLLFRRVHKHVLSKKLPDFGADRERFHKIFNLLHGECYLISSVHAVCPERLLEGFCIYRNNIISRLEDNKELFQKQEWKDQDKDGRRAWIKAEFDKKIALWNKKTNLAPIMICAHGTSSTAAWKICTNGFTAIPSAHDEGWYGKGIYFTTFANYCLGYLKPPNPAIIIACVIPGNPYPVIEGKQSVENFYGSAMKSGCQCHYVLTDNTGAPCAKETDHFFDELVIAQEVQVVPMYIVEIDPSNFPTLIQEWNKPLSTSRPAEVLEPPHKHSTSSDAPYTMAGDIDIV